METRRRKEQNDLVENVLGKLEFYQALTIEERPVSLSEIKAAARAGRILEIFGTGTAVVCQPVEAIIFPGGGGEKGGDADAESYLVRHSYDGSSLAEQMLGAIQDIQYGREPSHPWSVPVCPLAELAD